MRHFINVSRIGKYELLEGYAMVNKNFHIVTANEAMYQFMGIAKRYDIVDVIHPVDLDDFINTSNKEQREQLKNSFSETLHRELGKR